MSGIKVALCGAHGTGKTAAVRALAERLRREHPKIKVATVTEVARDCPWSLNEKTVPEAQKWIFHRQIASELEAAATGAEIILCDRSVLDNLAYAFVQWKEAEGKSPWNWPPAYLRLFTDWWEASYDRLWFFQPGAQPLEGDGFRSVNPDFQARVQEQINWLRRYFLALDWDEDWPGLDEAYAYLKFEIENPMPF